MDGFHLADAQLQRLGLLERKGAPDTFDAAGYASLLQRARHRTGDPVYAPGFDRRLEQPLAAALVVAPEARLVLTEGNYLLLDDPPWAAVRQQIDSVWFVVSAEDVRVERLVARHVEFGKSRATAAALGGRHRPTQRRRGVGDGRGRRPRHRQRCGRLAARGYRLTTMIGWLMPIPIRT